MNLKALVTLDLPDLVDNSKRQLFYDLLEKKMWSKINLTTTSWRISFKEGIDEVRASQIILDDLKSASKDTKINKVEYVFQLGSVPVSVHRF